MRDKKPVPDPMKLTIEIAVDHINGPQPPSGTVIAAFAKLLASDSPNVSVDLPKKRFESARLAFRLTRVIDHNIEMHEVPDADT